MGRVAHLVDTSGMCLESTSHDPPNVCHRPHGHLGWCSDPRSGATWAPNQRAQVRYPLQEARDLLREIAALGTTPAWVRAKIERLLGE